MSYNAIITKIESIEPIPKADFLVKAKCLGYNIVVNKDTKEGDIVILFPDDGQLSHEYCYENNLYNKPEMNKDPNAKCGFFSSNRRVKCQTFRGEKSEAYTASLDSISFTGANLDDFGIGTRFDEINGIKICNKYITDATREAGNANKVKNRDNSNLAKLVKSMFKEHMDTEQIRYASDSELQGLVTITHKLHGTSQRTGYLNVPVEIPLNVFQKGWNKFVDLIDKIPVKWANKETRANSYFSPGVRYEWQHILGTRRVVKGKVKDEQKGYRTEAAKHIIPAMQKGEVWYYEIVGYEGNETSIMPKIDLANLQSEAGKKLKDELVKRFGKQMVYAYGCKPYEFDVYVYRITVQNEDGDIYELPWSVVKDRCIKNGIKHVPEICQYITGESGQLKENEFRTVKDLVEYLCEETDIADSIDPTHIKEGVVVRVDSNFGKTKFYKQKTFYFRVLEGIIKDLNIIDTEEKESLDAYNLTLCEDTGE